MASPRRGDPVVRELEERLRVVTRERDALERDVEALCMSNGEFSASDVLGLRIRALETQVSKAETSLHAATAECDGLKEDLYEHKQSRKKVDESLKREMARNQNLEQELTRFLTESGTVIAERDRAMIEADRARAELKAAQNALDDVQHRMQLELDKLATAKRREQEAAARGERLEAQVEALLADLADAKAARERADAEASDASERAGALEGRAQEAEASLAALRDEQRDTLAKLEGSSAREQEHAAMIAETKESLRERDAEVAGLRNRVATLEADGKDQATQFAALEESLSSYQNYAQGLKTRLAQATSEKVQAMMEAAKLEAAR